MKITGLFLAGTMLLPPTLLQAGQTSAPRTIQAGLALNLGAPMGNLKSDSGDRATLTGSVILPIQIGQGWVIRPRLDFAGWNSNNRRHPGGEYCEDVDGEGFGAGTDLLFFPSRDTARGIFLSGGLGIQHWKLSYKAADKPAGRPTHTVETSQSKTSPSFALGTGYQFNRNIGLEFRVMTSEYAVLNKTVSAGALVGGTTETRHATSSQLAATFTW